MSFRCIMPQQSINIVNTIASTQVRSSTACLLVPAGGSSSRKWHHLKGSLAPPPRGILRIRCEMHEALIILHADILVPAGSQGNATRCGISAGDNLSIDGGGPVALARDELDGATLGGYGGEDGVVDNGVQAVVNDLEGGALGCVDVEICDGTDVVIEVVPGVPYSVVGERWAEVDGEGGGGTGCGVCLRCGYCKNRSHKQSE